MKREAARAPRSQPARTRRGFSLLEMVIAITLIGTLAVLAVPMLRLPLAAWMAASQRAELVQAAEVVNGQLAQDLRRALPGSVRVRTIGSRVLLEMLEVRASGRHRAGPSGAAQACPATCATAGANDVLEAGCNDSCFTSLGLLEGDPPLAGLDWVVVNPIGPGVPAGDPYFGGNVAVANGIKARLVDVVAAPEGQRVRHAAHSFTALAPSRRFFLVATPISWDCNPGTRTISRISGYAIAQAQPAAFAGAGSNVVMASGISACALRFVAGGGNASGTVLARVQFERASPGGREIERFELVAQHALQEGS